MSGVLIDLTLVEDPEKVVSGVREGEKIASWARTLTKVFNVALDFQRDVMLTERRRLPSDRIFVVPKDKEEPMDDDGLLGVYHARTSQIDMLLDNCSKVALHLRSSPELIAKKVLLHELSHLVSHLGVVQGTCPGCGETALFNWEDFQGSDSEIHEHFAQCGAYLAIRNLGDPDLKTAMTDLSRHQSLRYRSWEIHRALIMDGLSTDLAIRGFQDQFVNFLQSKPSARMRLLREHMMCYDFDE